MPMWVCLGPSIQDHTPVGLRSSLASWLGGAPGSGAQGPGAGGAVGQQELRSSLTVRAPNRVLGFSPPGAPRSEATSLSWPWHTGAWWMASPSCTCVCAQSCPTLCYPAGCSPPGSSEHGFSRQEYGSGLPSPPSGDLPEPGIELRSSASPALAGGFFTTEPPGKTRCTAAFGKVSDD